MPWTHFAHTYSICLQIFTGHISRLGHMLKHLLTKLVQLGAGLHPRVRTFREIFSTAKILPSAFLSNGQTRTQGLQNTALVSEVFSRSRRALRTIVMLQISFYITSVSRGIEIIDLGYFLFSETLAQQ